MKRTAAIATTLALAALSCAPALASEKGALFVGGGLSLDGSNWEDFLEDSGAAIDESTGGLGVNAHVGVQAASFASIRAGYRFYGEQSADVFVPGTFFNTTTNATLDVRGTFIAADLLVPINNLVGIGGTAGIVNWKADFDVGAVEGSDSGTDPFFGALVRLTPSTENFSFDFYVQSFTVDTSDFNDDITFTSAGAAINVHF
jgi:hypothetical protein